MRQTKIAPVAEKIDALIHRVESALERERRTSADIAHELRTPLSELLTVSEVSLRNGRDPDAAHRALRTVRDVAWRMGRSVSTLLKLARLQSGAESFKHEAVDLGAIVGDHLRSLSAVGREQSAILGSYFAALGEPIHRIYSGTLERQRETAQLVAAALAPNSPPLTVEPSFDEYESESILHAFAASQTPAQLAAAGWPGLQTDRRRFQFFLERAARAWVDAHFPKAP